MYGPLVAKVVYSWIYEDSLKDVWCLHILVICALRGFSIKATLSFTSPFIFGASSLHRWTCDIFRAACVNIVMGVPVMGSIVMGGASSSMIYGYVLGFDFMRCMGHCNVEVVPAQVFNKFPLLRYLIYTPRKYFSPAQCN
ncbi:hypothetical protein V6N13_106635 [Hibiscus sabdariffa]